MTSVTLAHPADFDGWRAAARGLLAAGVPPEAVAWRVEGEAGDLFGGHTPPPPAATTAPTPAVPRRFVELAQCVIAHADPERFALLHRALVRVTQNRALIDDAADPLIHRLDHMAKAVRRDIHKMRAFLRFRHVEDGDRFVAWFEPEHHIVRPNAGFFVRRFAQMRWSILTPELCAHWDGEAVDFTAGAVRADAPEGDPVEETWKTYYAHIFNPARLKIGAMTKEMPKKYWRNMPETALVAGLIATAQSREQAMIDTAPRARPLPPPASGGGPLPLPQAGEGITTNATVLPLPPAGEGMRASASGGEHARASTSAFETIAALAAEARGCERCPLFGPATQTVFGEGPADAPLMFVGEQPGDQEDLAGRPFVGPAGQMFNRALTEAGIDRTRAYFTNAVKHFKFEPRGKRRIHAKPDAGEIEACRWWIDRERAAIRPKVVVALGATAARSLVGKVVTIAKARGAPLTLADGAEAWITVHPSYLLRIEDPAAAAAEYARFVGDLARVRERGAELDAEPTG